MHMKLMYLESAVLDHKISDNKKQLQICCKK